MDEGNLGDFAFLLVFPLKNHYLKRIKEDKTQDKMLIFQGWGSHRLFPKILGGQKSTI